MIVDRITTFEQLDTLRARWNDLYVQDSQANFFLSWEWMRACLATQRKPWMVLGAREPNGPYAALLPLRIERFPSIGPAVNRELALAGNPRADYTGMLGLAGAQAQFLPALAREIGDLRWDNFTLKDYADDRIAALIALFERDGFRVAVAERTPSPYVELPATWEEYVSSRSYATRRTIRNKLRRIESLPGYRLHYAAPDEAGAAIEALLRINSRRWKKSLSKRRATFGELFARCYASGCCIVSTMSSGESVIAAQSSFLDARTRTVIGYMMGYDAAYAKFSPGAMIVCAAIRYAIEQGFAHFELSRGGESFKSSLATGVAYTAHATLTRPGVRVAAVNVGRRGFFAAKGLARQLLVRPA
jgi:CelD/BcsL family acetyltransferase involved in cellulose biosynthesis